MIPVEELKEHFLSPIRAELARKLRAKGWGQRAIARALGVSQAAVSKLLTEERRSKLSEIGIEGLEAELLTDRLLHLLIEGRVEDAAAFAHRYWLLVAASGGACGLHRRNGWPLESCSACTRALYPRLSPAKGLALADVERAVTLAESSPYLALVAPEVMINVARAAAGAVSVKDVAAVPGRLARIGNQLVARRRPTFGASRHLAEVLLASGYPACIDIKFDERIREAMGRIGLRWIEFSSGKYAGLNPAAEAIKELRSRRSLARAVADTGGLGIEPVTYVFGSSATEAVLTAEKIARYVGSPS